MTLPRYIASVATTYAAVLLVIVVGFGGWDVSSTESLVSLWPLFAGAIAMAVLGTMIPVLRFGDAGGSIYAIPTTIHVFVLILLGIAVWVELPR